MGQLSAEDIRHRGVGQGIDHCRQADGKIHLASDQAWEAALEMIVRSARDKKRKG